jgi:hypothetical protein
MNITKTIKNRRSGICYTCKATVAPLKGFACKTDGPWVCFCGTGCMPETLAKDIRKTETKTLTADGKIFHPYDPTVVSLLRSLPGARFSKDGGAHWAVSLRIADRPRILEVAERLGLEIAEVWREKAPELSQVKLAKDRGAYPFQVEGVAFLCQREKALLADDQGTGKTVQALLALPDNAAVLCVVPASVKRNWANETKVWRPDLTPVVLKGSKTFRFPAAGEVVITNPESLPKWMLDHDGAKKYPKPSWTDENAKAARGVYFIADEAHMYKGHKSQRSKKITALSTYCATAWALTGTPLLGKPFDLWGVLSAFGLNWDVFGSWSRFMSLFGGSKGRWGYTWGATSPEVAERMRRVMLRRTKAEVLPDLPSKVHQRVVVDVGSAKLRRAMDAIYEAEGPDGESIKGGRLPAFEEMAGIRAELAKDRVSALLDMVASYEDSGTPLVVFSAHKAPVCEVCKRDGWEAITGETPHETRAQIVADFQAGKLHGVALTIAAGGVGLTLTRASTMVFCDRDWTPALNIQAEDRIHRIGQTESCHYVVLTSDHPLDLRVESVLDEKMARVRLAIEGLVPVPPSVPSPSFVLGLSDDDWQSVVKENKDKEEAKKALALVEDTESRLDSWTAYYSANVAPKDWTTTKAKFDFLLDVCDGATTKDGEGFNKVDAAIARRLRWFGLEEPRVQRIVEAMLRKYANTQLAEWAA